MFIRLTTGNDLLIAFMEIIVVIDNDYDHTIINGITFLIESFAIIDYSVGEALNSMSSSSLKILNETFTFATLPDKKQGYFSDKPSISG